MGFLEFLEPDFDLLLSILSFLGLGKLGSREFLVVSLRICLFSLLGENWVLSDLFVNLCIQFFN